MGVTKSNQQLQHDLTTAAFAIEDAAYDLFRITERFGDAKPLVTMEIIEKLHKHADLLKDYADEVNAGKIAWSNSECRGAPMDLTKPNQQLRHDLQQAAALLKWSGVDLMQAAVRPSDAGSEDEAQELLKIAASYQELEDRLVGYAEEVKTGLIKRVEGEG